MTHTHDLSEWAAFLLLGVGIHGAYSAPWFLFVDARLADFRLHALLELPLPRLLLDTDAGARLTVAADNARHAFRETCRDLAALLILLTTSPKGAMAA